MAFSGTGKVWMNGTLVDWAQATMHVASHIIHYGSGVFEGARCYDTPRGSACFRLDDHMRRLYDSARIYRMKYELDQAALTTAVLDTIKANGLAGKKVFVGFDASPSLVSAMKAGEINALVAQNPLQMGYDTVRVMALHLRGEKAPQAVDTGCALVTKENLDTPEIKKVLGQ